MRFRETQVQFQIFFFENIENQINNQIQKLTELWFLILHS